MAAISQTITLNIFSEWNVLYFDVIDISLKLVPKDPVDNNPALV